MHRTYFIDALGLMRRIREQKATEYGMQLRIINNPHAPKENQKQLIADIQKLTPENTARETIGLDRAAFSRLKNKLYKSSKITVK